MCQGVEVVNVDLDDRSAKLSRLSRLFTVRAFYRSHIMSRDDAIKILSSNSDLEGDVSSEFDDSELLDCSISEILNSLGMLDW